MTWARIDDQFHGHPKVLRAWHENRASLGLHLLALSYAGAYLTDGHIPEAFVRSYLSGAAERRRTVGSLVDAGLWELTPSGWQIHDYLHFNASREVVLERRASRGRGGAEAPARAPGGDQTLKPPQTKS